MKTSGSIQFGSFTLDLDRLCVFGPRGRAELRRKSFEVLRYLIAHKGRVVGKEELIGAVWPNLTVTDESLTRCISEVRRALDDGSQQVIKTVPRRGYLFDVPISAGDDTATLVASPPNGAAINIAPAVNPAANHRAEATDGDLLDGERKPVTVLYADIKQSLERIAESDAEQALKVLDAVLKLMAQAVHQYGGTVSLRTAEGIIALFGAPVAHEDHAIRACYAALGLREAVRRYAERPRFMAEVPILARAGLSSGDVVIRSISSGPQTEWRAMGATAHLAARLGQAAVPGTLLISAETQRLAETQVEAQPLKASTIVGLDQPVCELLSVGRARTRFQALTQRGLTSFVGRTAELEQLERLQLRVQGGHGQLAAIIGEPGMGKSRLLHEYIHSHRTAHWLVLETSSVSHRAATSYLPVIGLLKTYFKIEASDAVREMRNKITGRLLGLDRSLAPDLPALMALLDIPIDDPAWHAVDAFQRRQRTFDALRRLIFRECQKQPVILAFEDLHWIDSETEAFLGALIDSLASAPLLLILTYRPEYQHRWGGKSYYTQLRLDVLSSETAEEFLLNLLGDDTSLLSLKELLLKQGNPLFLEESIRSLVETDVLAGKRGDYRLVRRLHELKIPPTVQAILAARIDRLSARDKRLLQAASVVGKDVPHAILGPIAELPEEELRRGVDDLREAELLYEVRLFPDVMYTFKHALTRDVAYESVLAEQRRILHRKIVAIIERLYPDRLTEQVERLAHHAVRGELWEKAVPYLRQAGNKAQGRSAFREARGWFEQAVGAIQKLPENHRTLEEAFEARLEMRQALVQLGEFRTVLEPLREAETLAERLDDDRRRGRVWAFMTNIHSLLGEMDQAMVTGARAAATAERLGDARLRILTTSYLQHMHYIRAEYDRVIELATYNLAALPADWVYEYFGIGAPPSVFDRGWLVMSLAQLGRFTEAGEPAAEAIRLAASTHHAHTIAIAHRAVVTLHLLAGDWTKARSLIEAGIAAVVPTGHMLLVSTAFASSAWVLAQLGDESEALRRLRDAEQLLERRLAKGVDAERSWDYHALGRAYLILGQLGEARTLADRALECCPAQPGYMAHALELLGDVATHPDAFDADAAETHYHQALALAQPRGMRPLVAHCYRGLGELYQRIGERRKAQEHLAMATAMYRDMGMRFWLEKAEPEL